MTVCMLVWDYWPGREGGAQRQCRKLSHALPGRGINAIVLTQRAGWLDRREIRDQDIPIIRLGLFAPLAAVALRIHQWKSRRSATARAGRPSTAPARTWGISTPFWFLARLSFMVAAARYLARHRRALSLIHVYESNWIAGFASWLGQRAGLPVCCKTATLPCLAPLGPDVPFRAALLRWRLQCHFIALHGAMAAELQAARVIPARIHVIPNGVDIPSGPAAPGENRDVLFVANFSQGPRLKAFDVLLTAWALVHRQNRLARLVMVGGGDSRPWRQLAVALGCDESIAFKGFSGDLAADYRRAAVFVLPSRTEGMSNALLEAQSYGLPAVVSAIPGNRAVISDEDNGLVVPVDDAPALAAAIVRLLQDAPLRAKLGIRARQRAMEDFSFALVAGRIHDLYVTLAAGAGGAH